ncbi:MAG: cytochrome c, partial [Proteobacteria bacterium]|nr:cytochrome c [Pseudomonadota bacterium]
WHHTDKVLFDYTKLGGQALIGGDFKSGMPGFKSLLSDDQIWAVLAYIKSTWPGQIRERQESLNRSQKP